MKKVFLFLAIAFIISCSKGNSWINNPIHPYNKENIDPLEAQSSLDLLYYDSAFYYFIDKRNEILFEKAKKKRDILIELHFPEDIYFSPYNKYVLNITNENAEGNFFMYMGKIQKHIYLKNYPFVGDIECPNITIMDLTDSIHYRWCPFKDDFPFRFHGNKITVFLSSNSIFPIYKQGRMSDEEQTIMNLQPDFIEELRTNTSILYKEYMDSIHQMKHVAEKTNLRDEENGTK